MAITWGSYSNRWRLGLDLVGNTMILYGESDAYGFNINNGTIVFGGDSSGSKAFSFYSGFGQTVRKELHRWSIGSGSHTATASVNHYVSGVGTINATVTRTRTVTPKPAAPRLDRVVRISDTSHRVEWARNATATSVRLERRTNDGSWQHVSSVSSNAASITDTTTKAGNKYQYRVRVANAGGTSDWSNLSNNIYTTPTAPTGVTATRVGNDIRVSMTMPARSTHLDIQDDGTTVVSALAKGSLPWTHSSPSPVVTHRYRARSRIASGTSDSVTLYSSWSTYSSTVQLTAAPNAPTGLNPNGSTVEPSAPITLRWQHNPVDSSQQSAVEIQSRLAGGSWGTVYTGATETTWSTTGGLLALGVGQVEWRVRTKGAHPDWSPWSAVAQFDVISKPTVTIQTPSAGDFHEAELAVTWSFFQGQGRPQSSWRARLVRDGQNLETKQGTGSATSTTFSHRLEDGHSYTVEVDAASGSIWSAVESVSVDASFVLPAPAVLEGVWNDGTGAADLQVSVLEQTPHADVINYAPRIEGSGSWAEVRRNLMPINPSMRNSLAGWDKQANVTNTATPAGIQVDVVSALANNAIMVRASSGNLTEVVSGVGAYTGAFRVHVPEGFPAVTVWTTIYWGSLGTGATYPVVIQPGETKKVQSELGAVPVGDVARVWLRAGAAIPAGARLVVSEAQLESATGDLDGFLDGSTTPETATGVDQPEDFRWRWLGEPNASESVMEIETVAGLSGTNAIAGVSTWEGKPAVRSIPTSVASNQSRIELVIPEPARESGTLVARTHLKTPLTGLLWSISRALRVLNPSQVTPLPPNAAGSYPQRLEYSDIVSWFRAYLTHGGYQGSGDIWHTDIGLYAGSYQSDFFDGDTEWVQIDGVWMHTRWNSDGTSVASMPDEAIAVTVERSIDGGITWALVADNLEPGTHQLTDPMALSNGVTLYRVTTYAATGAATVREFPVTSDSGAIWLGGGAGFNDTVALPHSPQVTVTASRERVLKRYSGRALPVVHSGEGVTRVVDTGGLVRVPWGDRTETDALERIALAGEPLALYRDPDGRWVVGMLGEVSMSRENHYWWAYGFTLTESEA